MQGSEIIVDKMYSEVCKRVIEPLRGSVIKIVDNCIDASKLLHHYIILRYYVTTLYAQLSS